MYGELTLWAMIFGIFWFGASAAFDIGFYSLIKTLYGKKES